VSKLCWEHVDRENRLLAVPGAITKNRTRQTIALKGIWELVELSLTSGVRGGLAPLVTP
jgi:hypothetical protein